MEIDYLILADGTSNAAYFDKEVHDFFGEHVIIIKDILNTSFTGKRVSIKPNNVNPYTLKEYKAGNLPIFGLLEYVIKDQNGFNWFQILSVVNDEPIKFLFKSKSFTFFT